MAFGQQPDKGNSLLSSIGISPKKPSPQAPRSLRDKMQAMGGSDGADPLVTDPAASATPDPNAPQQGTKISQDEAGYIPAGQCCGSCLNFTKETGDCAKVEGMFQAHDACKTMYEAANTQQQQPTDDEALESMTGAPPSIGAGSQAVGAGAVSRGF